MYIYTNIYLTIQVYVCTKLKTLSVFTLKFSLGLQKTSVLFRISISLDKTEVIDWYLNVIVFLHFTLNLPDPLEDSNLGHISSDLNVVKVSFLL